MAQDAPNSKAGLLSWITDAKQMRSIAGLKRFKALVCDKPPLAVAFSSPCSPVFLGEKRGFRLRIPVGKPFVFRAIPL